MSKRTKIILTIIIVIILALLILILYLNNEDLLGFFKKKEVTLTVNEEVVAEPETPTGVALPVLSQTLSSEEVSRAQLAQFSASFAEKFGSYSNQNNYQHFKELKALMTSQMWSWVESNLIDPEKEIAEVYSGETTKALSTQEIVYDPTKGEAEFLVKCQRQEVGDNIASPRVYYQDITVKLKKYEDSWLVDDATWQ